MLKFSRQAGVAYAPRSRVGVDGPQPTAADIDPSVSGLFEQRRELAVGGGMVVGRWWELVLVSVLIR